MKFFVPGYKDETKAKELFEAVRQFAADTLGWEISDRRVFCLKYSEFGKAHIAPVGQRNQINGELTTVILKSNAFSSVPQTEESYERMFSYQQSFDLTRF
jgi:hypothetical protein